MKYLVEITEFLQRIVEIEAESDIEAEEKVRKLYRREKIVLDSEDFVEVEFKVLPQR